MGSIWQAGQNLLLWILTFFYDFTNSYGLAILMLTVLVRILLHPLSHKQLVSMQKMQKLQPRIKMIQEKFANDKDRLNKEVMMLYKEHNVNPAAGCLPLLLQLPILIMLFNTLNDQTRLTQLLHLGQDALNFLSIRLDQTVYGAVGAALGVPPSPDVGLTAIFQAIATNAAGLANVGSYLGSVVLIVLVGVVTWLQQQLSSGSNPQMAFMNWFMPLFLTFICLGMPGGVLLYWAASSCISVGQQLWVHHRTEIELKQKPVLLKEKPKAGKQDKQDEEYEQE